MSPNMKLIKFCRLEHHISTVTAIQIGTLDYYRAHDSAFIADAGEGTSIHSFCGTTEIVFSQGEVERIFSGSNIQFHGSGITLNPGAQFQFFHTVPNCPVFCCSWIDPATTATAAALEYDSFYEIADVELFVKLLGAGIYDCLKGTLPERITSWTPIRGLVRYQDSRMHEHDCVLDQMQLMKLALFTKPRVSELNPEVVFERNAEFRVAWMVMEGADWFSLPSKPILVPVTDKLRATCRW